MELYDAMSTLRAVRRLKPDKVPDEILHRILEAATWAPSGGNAQPWRIVAVKDENKKAALRDLYLPLWRRFSKGYPERIAALPERERDKQLRALQAGDDMAENLHRCPVIFVFCFKPSLMTITDEKQQRPSVVGGASVYPAVQNLLLACRAEGLGCTLTTLLCYSESEVRSLLAIPEDWYTCAAIPVGYPARGGHGRISRRPVEKMAFLDVWGEALMST